ncbi:hypothetical protein P154DRAFT_568998 [Amniculicola lignicola CBS 123094]|uniref:Uncharacterized protein n=1 Tax=Amniculicola lignicola CBS 123094 TaxID=1392246 RepID=A0A6A5X5E6_9PLEO|nr:hypothetical protein P154DRAFT_568998 [Amniculicola lignicola CBS 123094]
MKFTFAFLAVCLTLSIESHARGIMMDRAVESLDIETNGYTDNLARRGDDDDDDEFEIPGPMAPDPDSVPDAPGPAPPPMAPPYTEDTVPSARNNYHWTATGQSIKRLPDDLAAMNPNVGDSVKEMEAELKKKNMDSQGPWLFWSGFPDGPALRKSVELVEAKISQKLKWMDTVLPSKAEEMAKWGAVHNGNYQWHYWAIKSQALAKVASGDIYHIVPDGRPLNKPYRNRKGSNWWSYEIGELTRRDEVKTIRRVFLRTEEGGNIPTEPEEVATLELFMGDSDDGFDDENFGMNLIWESGQEPMGWPGDVMAPPTQPFQTFDPINLIAESEEE